MAAEPDSDSGRQVKGEALALLLEQSGGDNLWERMWITTEIEQLKP